MKWGWYLLLVLIGGAHAAPGRYAIVIGNNSTHSLVDGKRLPDLNRADEDAKEFKRALVEAGRFDDKRVMLLLDAEITHLREAASRVREGLKRDAKLLEPAESLFVLYYSGHGGPDGELLTLADPITGEDLLAAFETIDADHEIGVFDSCYAGNLVSSSGAPREKGVIPGDNPHGPLFNALSAFDGVLLAGAQGVAHETGEEGGVFTWYLLEALREGRSFSGTLGDVFEHARAETEAYAKRVNRIQEPRSQGLSEAAKALQLGYPHTAELIIGPGITGEFVLAYKDGLLRERVAVAGEGAHVEVAAGQATIIKLTKHASEALATRMLKPYGRLHVRQKSDPPRSTIGYLPTGPRLLAKGGAGLALDVEDRVRSLSLGVGYAWLPADLAPAARHGGEIILMGRDGPWVLNGAVRLGRRVATFSTWSVTVTDIGPSIEAGTGLTFSSGTSADLLVRLGVGIDHRVWPESGSTDTTWWAGATPTARVSQRIGAFVLAAGGGWTIRSGPVGLRRGAGRAWWSSAEASLHVGWAIKPFY